MSEFTKALEGGLEANDLAEHVEGLDELTDAEDAEALVEALPRIPDEDEVRW